MKKQVSLTQIDKVVSAQIGALEEQLVNGLMNGFQKNGHPFDNGLVQDALIDLRRELYNVAIIAIEDNGFEIPELASFTLHADAVSFALKGRD